MKEVCGELINSVDDLMMQKAVFWRNAVIGRWVYKRWPLWYARNQIADGNIRYIEGGKS